MFNPILRADSYKLSHFEQYPANTQYMFDYFESRGGKYGYTRFFGLQYYLSRHLTQEITQVHVDQAEAFTKAHGVPFHKAGWQYIVDHCGGKLPLHIRALPEGAVVPNRTALFTVESTDPNCFWLVGWAETLLMKVWYPTTVASFSYKMRLMIERFLMLTSDVAETDLLFKLHDFGCRGASSEESAGIGSMAHLINFTGTDSMIGIEYAQAFYNTTAMVGFSVPASEHSTMTSWQKANETAAYKNMLTTYAGYPVVSIVVDSYDFFDAVANKLLGTLLDQVKAHQGFVTIRPDSGDALSNIRFILKHAAEKVGFEINSKGYKVLKNIRILQGDGVNEDSVYDILQELCSENDEQSNGWSAENFIFGCGGALLQGNAHSSINRDTHRFAVKCSAIMVCDHGIETMVEVYKDPITDRKKSSKRGRLDVILVEDCLQTVSINHLGLNAYHPQTQMRSVFKDGAVIDPLTFEMVRANETKYRHHFNFGAAHIK